MAGSDVFAVKYPLLSYHVICVTIVLNKYMLFVRKWLHSFFVAHIEALSIDMWSI